MKTHFMPFIFLLIAFGCLEESQIQLPSDPARLVLDAVVSSTEGESYVVIGWSSVVNATCQNQWGDAGVCEPGVFSGPYKLSGLVTIVEIESGRTVVIPFQMNDKHGRLLLKPSITGQPGFGYRLTVEVTYEGKTALYSSTTRMIKTPEITGVSLRTRKGPLGKSNEAVPLISFTEPRGVHFYLFQLCTISGQRITCGNSRVWPYSVLADTFLPSEVNGLSVDDGASIVKYATFYPNPDFPGTQILIRMYSIEKDAFDFYKSLFDQFDNDGGAFSPTPATPEGNISNGAIGLFRALDESSAAASL